MTDDLGRIKKLFLEVLAQPTAAARRAKIDEVCASDTELKSYLLELLEAHEEYATPVPEGSSAPVTKPDGQSNVLASGTIIDGKYKIIELIGEGGMGAVYKARRADPKMDVALKVIKPGMDSRQVLGRFKIERQALAMMNHDNIAKVLDAGMTEQGRPYFVMELIKGLPLNKFCDENKLPVAQRLELFAKVCSAVQHAHQKGIVHRDLKPSNILVGLYDEKAVPKIVDFGLAKALHQLLTDDSVDTRIGTFVGTWLYTAPEQAQLNNLDIDTRADIYSLGVILYELLTGKTPIEKARLKDAAHNELLRIIREEEPPVPSEKIRSSAELPSVAALRRVEPLKLQKLVRGDLDWIVMKALDKDRNRRYATANELAEDVQHYLHDEPVKAGPPTLRYRLSKVIRKHKGKVLVASLLAATILVGAIVSTVGWTLAHRENVRANQQAALRKAVNDFLTEDLLSQADPAIQIRPDQKFISDLTVKQLLDRTAAMVGRRFAGQPLVEAGIRHTLGKAYLGLGDLKSARLHLEKAEELRKRESGDNDPDRLDSLHELGWLYLNDGKTSQAEATLNDAADRRLKILGAMHPDTLKTRQALAFWLEYQGKLDEAKALFNEVLQKQKQVLSLHDRNTLATQRQLAGVLQAQQDLTKAEQLLVEVLDSQTDVLGPEHPEVLVTQNNLAMLYAEDEKKEYAKAERLLLELVPISERILGAEHPAHLAFKVNLATVFSDLDRLDEAIVIYEQTIPAMRRISGLTVDHTLAAIQNYAAILANRSEFAKAEPLLLEAYSGCQRALGDRHWKTKQIVDNLIRLYGLMAKPDRVKHWKGVRDKAKDRSS